MYKKGDESSLSFLYISPLLFLLRLYKKRTHQGIKELWRQASPVNLQNIETLFLLFNSFSNKSDAIAETESGVPVWMNGMRIAKRQAENHGEHVDELGSVIRGATNASTPKGGGYDFSIY